ncbi:methyl-accepting chemotaxis protein II [Janthinobacterium sp. HH103]|uniref:methyl-accepting chemotaxis protein n=1 Tax=unclassified Janthinobacterium TaxID=2610881 RepID=UPI0008742850|nr:MULTISPECIES: methyl-accepting chemotaxis protein [unclassified Janthinobacterium]OEZ69914.1 methyl-accepting chemotaxis protein II [Janthinobacterium sp. HH100]OEZ71311.1 methyl-accepting chemotaxis protein II [Janthinobacterium sp. HH103]QOU74272.1 Methyl-accepting chemotaxis protein (MCP) signaling domain protein [Janthinobacterium sp. HH102]
MDKFTVRTQLTLAFGLLVFFLIGISILSVRSFSNFNASFDQYVNGITARANTAHRVRDAIDMRAVAARNLVLVTKPEDLEIERKQVLQAQAEVVKNMQHLLQLTQQPEVSDEVRAIVNKIDGIEKRYSPVAMAIVDLALQKKTEQAIVKMNEECRPLLAALVAASDEYFALTDQRSTAILQEDNERYTLNRNILIGASLLSIVLAALAGWLITRSLLKALGAEPKQLCDAVSLLAGGDLTGKLNVAPHDTASVLSALQRMQESLTTVVSSVRQDSDTVSLAAAEISSGNSDLSLRTEQQASSLEETASSMEELTSTVRKNAENAREANVLATTASDVASKGGAVVGQVMGTMDLISESSRKIVDIISVIDGIAFQTNILALNAAVEAARAGEQGRGFAVVATEVRGLAQRSASAAKEIKALIDDSVSRVDAGSRLAAQAGTTMSEVVASVARVSNIIAEITVASQEQSAGIEQINQAVTQMDSVTQQNASLVEEAAAAAESLREQASHLVETVSIFKTHDSHLAAPAPAPAPARASHKPLHLVPATASSPAKRQAAPAKPRAAQAEAVTAGDWEEF